MVVVQAVSNWVKETVIGIGDFLKAKAATIKGILIGANRIYHDADDLVIDVRSAIGALRCKVDGITKFSVDSNRALVAPGIPLEMDNTGSEDFSCSLSLADGLEQKKTSDSLQTLANVYGHISADTSVPTWGYIGPNKVQIDELPAGPLARMEAGGFLQETDGGAKASFLADQYVGFVDDGDYATINHDEGDLIFDTSNLGDAVKVTTRGFEGGHAAKTTNPGIDAVFLVVADYEGSTMVIHQLTFEDGLLVSIEEP